MKTLKEAFKYLKKAAFISDFTQLNPMGGVQSRIEGKPTNAKDKRTEPTPAETAELKAGLLNCADDMIKLANTL